MRERAAEHEVLEHVDLRVRDAAAARARRLVRGRAHSRHALDRRRDRARHPHRRGPRGAHGRLQVRRGAARRRDVRRRALRGARRARGSRSSSATRRTSTPRARRAARRASGSALEAIVAGAEQAVVVAMFASNVHRLRDARRDRAPPRATGSCRSGGASTRTRASRSATARSTGDQAGRPYLEWPADLVWPAERARELPQRAILAVATGSQGESAAALARLARGEHPALDLGAGRRGRPLEPGHPGQRARGRARDERSAAARRRATHLVVEPRRPRQRPRPPPGAAADDRARPAARVRSGPRDAAPSPAARGAGARARRAERDACSRTATWRRSTSKALRKSGALDGGPRPRLRAGACCPPR